MEKEGLNFSHNACAIDVKVAGMTSQASGFVYRTKPLCEYDYVLTVKHAFQEGNETPNEDKFSNLTIHYGPTCQNEIKLYNNKLKDCFIFFDELDLAIIKVKKQYDSNLKRIAVHNAIDSNKGDTMVAHSFITIYRKESTKLDCEWKEQERGIIRVDNIKDIKNYGGASGSGIYNSQEPFLIGLISSYRLPNFEQNELLIVKPDWSIVNEKLHSRKWTRLNDGNAHYTTITEDKSVIDIRELQINGAFLNMEIALKRMQHDLIDDWFFDPLHYVDMCNIDFVMNYFSIKKHREEYKAEKMEVFYLPKKTFVLRKAMVGTFMDRLLYMAVVGQLGKLIDSHLSRYVFSARYNTDTTKPGLIVYGVEQWIKMNYLIYDWAMSNEGCLVKLDLLNYYDTINKNTLIRFLNEIVQTDNEKACVKLLRTLLNGFADKEINHGIPQNSDSSSLLATFYVSHVDEIILSKAMHYCRFMDDMYFVAKDIYEARNILQTIEKHLRQIDLSLNAQKIKFVKLNDPEENKAFVSELLRYDHEKCKIKYLMRSCSKSKRMNAMALLMKQLDFALKPVKESKDVREKDRALKFSTYAFSSLHLQLESNWDFFYQFIKTLVKEQVDTPDHTPLICRLVSALDKGRDIIEIKNTIKELLLRKIGSLYEWQAYHLWMLVAYLHFDDSELMRYAVEEIEKNDETRRVEVAAIIIYVVTINKEYARMILHRLRDEQLHGNLQYRCALIAMRALDEQVLDEEVKKSIGNDALCLCHGYLNKHEDKSLVFFHRTSSFLMEQNELIFPEHYSGL